MAPVFISEKRTIFTGEGLEGELITIQKQFAADRKVWYAVINIREKKKIKEGR